MISSRPKLRLCSVSSCKSKNEQGITYHSFPNEPLRRREWLKALGWKGSQVNERSAVCSKHFRSKDYYPGLNRIFLHSVPSLKLKRTVPKGKEKPKKGGEKQTSVKKPVHNSFKITKSSDFNARKTLTNKAGTSSKSLPIGPSKKTYINSQNRSGVNKKENNGSKKVLSLDSSRKLHRGSPVKKTATACQRKKILATKQFGSRTNPSRFGSTSKPSRHSKVSRDNENSPNLKKRRKIDAIPNTNKTITLKTNMVENSQEIEKSLSSSYSNSTNTKQSEDDISIKTISSVEFRGFSSLYPLKSTNSKSSQIIIDSKNFGNRDDENVDRTDDKGNAVNTNHENVHINTIDKTDETNICVDVNKTKDEDIEIPNTSDNYYKPIDNNFVKSNDGKCERNCVKSVQESNDKDVKNSDVNYIEKENCIKSDQESSDKDVKKSDENHIEKVNCSISNQESRDMDVKKSDENHIEKVNCFISNQEFRDKDVKKPDENHIDKANCIESDQESSDKDVKKSDENHIDKANCIESDQESSDKDVNKSNETQIEKADCENVKPTDDNNTESTTMIEKTILKRTCEETNTYSENKRKRTKRKRLISTSSQDSNETTNDRTSLCTKSKANSSCGISSRIRRDKKKSRKPTRTNERVNSNLQNIEKIIYEMQNKIQNLERKSVLDEKKIETFKKALIEQRDSDIKLLMDEKENELLLRMDLLYLDYDPKRICRLCLLLVDKKESLTSLFIPSKNEPLIPLIKNVTGVQIEPEDGMPCGICDDCLQQMKRIDWIKRRTQRSNDLIMKFVAMKKNFTEMSNVPPSPIINTNNHFFEEELSDTFKIEDVFSLDATTSQLQFVKEEPLSDEEEDSKPVWFEDIAVVNFETKPRKRNKCKKCSTLFTDSWSFKGHMKYCNKRFQCSECRKSFWNSYLFRCHKQRRHSCVSELSLRYCQECEIPFRWKHQLLFHIIQHSPVSCQFCSQEYQSTERLRRHFLESH